MFLFEESVHELGVRGVYYNIRGLANAASTDPRVRAVVDECLAAVPVDLEGGDALRGFRALHAAVSAKPDKLIAAPAGLLAFYRARGDIPRINGIVDVYNAISLASGVAIGAHDLAHVAGDIALRLTRGDEHFWPLGAVQPVPVPAGEYAYVDAANDVLCRLEVRQVEKTKITLASRDVFFIVQGHDRMAWAAIAGVAERLAATCRRLFGGVLEPLYP